jgi:hypothetical protein
MQWPGYYVAPVVDKTEVVFPEYLFPLPILHGPDTECH